jgi:hypothetical protein
MSLTNDFTRTERPAKPYPEFPLYSGAGTDFGGVEAGWELGWRI